jgi:hypothetical protein
MKTSDVRIGKHYLYKNRIVKVEKRIQGAETKQRNMHSGELFTGFVRTRKRFLLDNGLEVFSDKLMEA